MAVCLPICNAVGPLYPSVESTEGKGERELPSKDTFVPSDLPDWSASFLLGVRVVMSAPDGPLPRLDPPQVLRAGRAGLAESLWHLAQRCSLTCGEAHTRSPFLWPSAWPLPGHCRLGEAGDWRLPSLLA